MANRANRNNVEESAEDIHNDVSQLGKVRISGEILLG